MKGSRQHSSEKFAAEMEEVMAEADDMIAHPEKYKTYPSTKEMFIDMGLDVSKYSGQRSGRQRSAASIPKTLMQ